MTRHKLSKQKARIMQICQQNGHSTTPESDQPGIKQAATLLVSISSTIQTRWNMRAEKMIFCHQSAFFDHGQLAVESLDI